MITKHPIFVALDVTPERAFDLIEELAPLGVGFKIGTATGFRHQLEVINYAKFSHRAPVFLDLKWANTPEAVVSAVLEAVEMGIDLCNVMISDNGRETLEPVAKAVQGTNTQVIGVTVLTTRDDGSLAETGIYCPVMQYVLRLARLAKDCGLHGVVASPQEVEILRCEMGSNFRLTIPGITFGGKHGGDQKRTGTPAETLAKGATDLVIGSAITKSADPKATTLAIIEEITALLRD